MVVAIVAVAGQPGVRERRHQRRRDLLADLVLGEAAQKPGAAGVRCLHLEGAIELHRMADDLVGDEGVVVRIGDDHDLTRGRRQRRRRAERDRLARELQAEFRERREADERFVDAAFEDLPAPLVPEDVVELLAHGTRHPHQGAAALGQRERLVDEAAFGRGEELAGELGERGDPVVGESPVHRCDSPRDVDGVGEDVLDAHRARIFFVDRGHRVLADVDRMEPGIGERGAQRTELLARVRLHLGVHEGAPVGTLEGVTDDTRQILDVGRAEREAEIAGRQRAVARQHADAEAEGVVVAARLAAAVLGRCRFRLGDLEPHVGVGEVGQAAGAVTDDVADVRLQAVDQLDTNAGPEITHRRTAPPSPRHQRPRRHGPPPARSDSCR